MKKKIILVLTTCLFAAGSIISVNLAQNNHNIDVSLRDIMEMAKADYEVGLWGTNWKKYNTECTYTKTTGFSYIYVYTKSTSYSVTKDVCGSGWGTCLPSAGC